MVPGAHLNWPHWKYGAEIYVGVRAWFAIFQVIQWLTKQHLAAGWFFPLSAFLVVVVVFVTNDKPFWKAEADNGPDGKAPFPEYAWFEVLNGLPVPLTALMLELVGRGLL